MILKIELYLDADFIDGVENHFKGYQKSLRDSLTADAISGNLVVLEKLLNVSTKSYEFLSKEEILERMRTKGK
jgi:hypothetical protein